MNRSATATPARPADPAPASADPNVALVRYLGERKSQLASLLGVELSGERGPALLDRFVTVALHAATSNPDLMRATTESLFESIRDAAMYGLEPVGYSGDGAIVVYNEKRKIARAGRTPGTTVLVETTVPVAHFQPMYRGLLKLARRSREIAVIDAHVVYEGDDFELETGSAPFVRHRPTWDPAKRGGYLGAYAVAKLANGETMIDPMTFADIEVTRKASRAATGDAWSRYWPEMARKTALRRLMKRLPLDSLAERALRDENEAEDRALPINVTPVAASEARSRIAARFVGGGSSGATTASGGAAGTVTAISAGSDSTGSAGSADETDAADENAATDTVERSTAESRSNPEADEIEAREVCGAESDPALGDVEICVLLPDHDLAAGGSKAHKAASGTVWPAAKRKEGSE